MSRSPSYGIQSNLSEKQIEADVATYMGWCTPTHADVPFRLFDVDESVTGADKIFNCGAVVYMQFKKSEGLKPTQKGTDGLRPTQQVSTRKNRSKLEEIREFRGAHGLEDNPSLYFQLRAKAQNAEHLQHNVLLAYHRPPFSQAVYVAPLLLDKTAYSQALFDSTRRFLENPLNYRNVHILHRERWTSIFNSVPFLRAHISIPPHERVETHEHYFSYSEQGRDVAWHSPTVVSRKPSRLSDFVASFFDMTINNGQVNSIDELAKTAEEIASRHGYSQQPGGENGVERLMSHGRWLLKTHGIRQFLLLVNVDNMAKTRIVVQQF